MSNTSSVYHSHPKATQAYQDTPTQLNNYIVLLFVDDPTHSHVITKLLAIHLIYEFRWNLKHVQMYHMYSEWFIGIEVCLTIGQRSLGSGSGGYTRTLLLGMRSFDTSFKLASPKVTSNA